MINIKRLSHRNTFCHAFILAGVLVYFLRFDASLIDDTYITLQYARNVAFHGTWGLLPGLTANTATSPLNVIVLAISGLVIRDLPAAAVVLTAIECFLILLACIRLARKLFGHPYAGWLAGFGFIFNPLLNSTIGLESYLFVLLFLAALLLLIDRQWNRLGIVLGLLTLTRMDAVLILLLLPIAVHWKDWLRIIASYLAAITPWFLFSWICLGSLVPDTLMIKAHETWGSSFADGLRMYFIAYRGATAWSLLFVVPAVFAVGRWDRRTLSALVIGSGFVAMHFIAYALLGIPPYHWYYMPLIMGITLAGALGLGRLHQQCPERSWRRVALTLLIPLYSLYMLATVGAADGWRPAEVPIHTNWATPAQYRRIAEEVRAVAPVDTAIKLRGETGTLVYYSERKLFDLFTDRAAIMYWIKSARNESGLRGLIYRFNFYWLKSPPQTPKPQFLLMGQSRAALPDLSNMKQARCWAIRSQWNRNGFVLFMPIPKQALARK